ncbi:MFS transporter [Burkholderia metallica]|uniref:MFS transporter n=1 Tax=Burkholderia metallica TaxID=488729 RepID=UPI001575B19E|nr:MFS transporter [Burkholderia metallica]NTZ10065.1 MFS transporter [Burkholderia metallica]
MTTPDTAEVAGATTAHRADAPPAGLPVSALLALATTGFLALLTETFPAGMLAHISASFSITEALAGQFVTLYAIGSLVAAIPLIAITRGWRRRKLMLATLASLLIFNTVTAVTTSYVVALAARFLAGMAGGLIWGMLAGYARRMVRDPLKGRALALAGVGAPLALSLGVPIGTFLGASFGWRYTFGLVSALTFVAIVWVLARVPDYPGQAVEQRDPILKVFATPGVRPVLAVLVCWVLAHSILYTYLVPFIAPAGLASRVDVVLFVFGVASLASIWLSGLLVDRMLRPLVLAGLTLFALTSLALAFGGREPVVVYLAMAVWGLTFGGSAALLQTASAEAAGAGADVAQSILVTAWNLAIAAGGAIGGVLLQTWQARSFPWVLIALLLLAILIAWRADVHGFPPRNAARAT